jgi:hypothetical protein
VTFAEGECSAFAGANAFPPTVDELRRQRSLRDGRPKRKIRSLLPQLQRGQALDGGLTAPPASLPPNLSKTPK